MKKTSFLILAIVGIITISAAIVYSHPEWRGTRPQEWNKDDMVTLEGTITDAERPIITMEAEGKEYTLRLGPAWYWEDKEVVLEKDKAIKVTGIVDDVDGKLHVYPYTIESDGKTITLADEDGVPSWRGGRGRGFGGRGGYGPGAGMYGRRGMYGHGFRAHHRACW